MSNKVPDQYRNMPISRKSFSFLCCLSLGLMLCSCAPKDSIVVSADAFTSEHVSGATELESLIITGDFLYNQKDYSSLNLEVEKYLEGSTAGKMGRLYARNLQAELLTYHVIDFERSFTLNEELIAECRAFLDQDDQLAFNRKGKKFIKPTLGARALYGTAIVIGGWVDPKVWSEAKEHMIGDEVEYTIKDTDFVKKFFAIQVKDIKIMAKQRLTYLEELIGG